MLAVTVVVLISVGVVEVVGTVMGALGSA